jgi:glycosyltransferase involved in cell wall biosynthesis
MIEPGASPALSVIVPMHNEADVAAGCLDRLAGVLRTFVADFEIIVVDDGSTDGTFEIVAKQRGRIPEIRLLQLSRVFGKDIALAAGLDLARGAAVVPIDADLQDPPELIGEMLAAWRDGAEVVFAIRRSRTGEPPLRRALAKIFYRLIRRISHVDVPLDAGDFVLLDRRVVEVLREFREQHRYFKGLVSWVGFRRAFVHYDREARAGGSSKWNLGRLYNFSWDAITGLSGVPLQIWTLLGFAVAAAAFLYGGALIVYTLWAGVVVPGYISLMVGILFFGGIQLMTVGIMGQYLSRLYLESKQRPLYVVRRRDDDGADAAR